MHFDWTVTVGDMVIVVGGVASLVSTTMILLYRICQRLDRIETMAQVAAARTNAIDLHAVATVAAATGAAVALPVVPGLSEKSD